MGLLFVLFVICVSATCGGASPRTHEAATHGDDHALHVGPDQAAAWGIETGIVAGSDIASRVSVPGVLGLNENRTAHISSYVTGKVVGLSVDLGSYVAEGEVLLTINSPEFASAQAKYLDAHARCKLAGRDYERGLELWESRSIEERELLLHEADLEQCLADLAAAESILHSYGIDRDRMDALTRRREDQSRLGGDSGPVADANLPIYSPIEGRVIYRDVVVGEHVDPTRTLFTVSQLGTLWAQLDVYETDLPFVRTDSDVIIESSLHPAIDFPGRIVYMSDVVDETLRTVKARVEVTNVDGLLKPNMFVQGAVQNRDVSGSVVAIPDEAIVLLHGEQTIFLLAPPEEGGDHLEFLVRHIQTGALIGDSRIVTSGLAGGETIVLKGAFALKSELEKGSGGGHEGHIH